jgi:hypothetical protein
MKWIFILITIICSFTSAQNQQNQLLSLEEARRTQVALGFSSDFINVDPQVDVALIESWKSNFPEIYKAWLAMPQVDQQFVTLFRGIDLKKKYSEIDLNQFGKEFSFGPWVYLSLNPEFASIYSSNRNLFKFRIPIGFFTDQRNELQFLLSTKNPAANLNAFVVEVSEAMPQEPRLSRKEKVKLRKFIKIPAFRSIGICTRIFS